MSVNYGDTTYVFRLQDNQGTTGETHDLKNTIKHWGESTMYDSKKINALKSSNSQSLNQPTSIPSPFARISLVKTAFQEVADQGENALKAYQKIVSDSLDVAEIFFNYPKWKDYFTIIKWDKTKNLEELKFGHNQLYKTLKTFLDNDAASCNFDQMQGIYILKHRNSGEMIGATSPRTLFFSSANTFSNIKISLHGQRDAFTNILPLHKRDWSFQKYLYWWFLKYNVNRIEDGRAESYFNEFSKYLESQMPLINRNSEIEALANAENTEWVELDNPRVEVLDKPLYFNRIVSPENWAAQDVFEDSIINVKYAINKERFFDGKIPQNSEEFFLLPIKDKFFEKFTTHDLEKFLTINFSGSVVEVKLKIGDQDRIISKEYKKSENTINTLTNFDCAIFPNVKFAEDAKPMYRFGVVSDFNDAGNLNVKFKKIVENAPIDGVTERNSIRNVSKADNNQLKTYSLEGSNFDYIQVEYKKAKGIIIPKFKESTGNHQFTFAIDFGTTNTHIEYKRDRENAFKPFFISDEDRQVHYLHGGEERLKKVFDEEYIPSVTDDEFLFPMRSALSWGEGTVWNNVYPFEKASLNELYEKRIDFSYNNTTTDLKWSNIPENVNQVKAYIGSIMYMLRNKVVLNNGNLAATKIVWLYPVSMERSRFENLNRLWNESYRHYFGNNTDNITSIPESIAPYEYYKRDGASNLVTIDIGGGTTDIVYSRENRIDFITSFRFAANALFGDGYSENNRVKNGIVAQFIDAIYADLNNATPRPVDDLFSIFNNIKDKGISTDTASFLFSLKQNKYIRKVGKNLAENANLSQKLILDTSQKITFIFFYAAIIYHLAKLMKAKNLGVPDKIVFSGNGSRSIEFITTDQEVLKGYTQFIFKKFFGSVPPNSLAIILNTSNPKEATCKGALLSCEKHDYATVLNTKVVLHTNGTDRVIARNEQEGLGNESNKYKAIDDAYIHSTVAEVEEFIDYVFESLSFFSQNDFGLNNESIRIAKDKCKVNLLNYLKSGMHLKGKKDDIADEIISETLFFYPLIGMLKDLTVGIYEKSKTNN